MEEGEASALRPRTCPYREEIGLKEDPPRGFIHIGFRRWGPQPIVVFERELKVPPSLGELFRELKVFERKRKSFEVKVFAVADYMEGSIDRRRLSHDACLDKATRYASLK